MTEIAQPPPWIRRAILTWWGVGVALWATWKIAIQLEGLLTQIVLALFISFALEPVVDALMRRGIRRSIATAISLLGLLVATIIFLGLMGSLIASQLTELVDQMPEYLRSGRDWINDGFNIELNTEDIIDQLQSGGAASQFASRLGDVVTIGTTAATRCFRF